LFGYVGIAILRSNERRRCALLTRLSSIREARATASVADSQVFADPIFLTAKLRLRRPWRGGRLGWIGRCVTANVGVGACCGARPFRVAANVRAGPSIDADIRAVTLGRRAGANVDVCARAR
jgi:hypothetical protein